MAPWWEDQAADWTQGQPGRILDLLTTAFEQRVDIQLFARVIGLDWRAAPGGTTSARDTWLWVLRRAAVAEQIPDLVAEILNHPRSAAFHAPFYRVLGEGSFVVDARRALRHGLAALPGNADSFGDRIRSAASEPSDTPVGSLEAITSPPSGLGDPKAYAQAIINATRRIAMIEVAGRPRGTGLLVGPDLLLTAAHVLDSRCWPPPDAVDVVAVFDYFPMPGRSPAETGTRVGVSEFVYGSLPTEAEADGRVLDWDAPADRLDFAILRLASRVPDAPGAPMPRGHYRLGPESYAFDQAPLLFIVQHPLGEFQAFSYVRQSPQRNDKGTRIRYRSNTLLGSSGSPVIDTVGRLVAIHHYSATGTNQAVPVSEIAKTILASPYASLLAPGGDGRSVPVAVPTRVVADEELQRCVVSISYDVGKKRGSGFFIAPRTILTTKHILTEAIVGARYKISQSGREFAAHVIAVPEELDLAVLEADEPSQFWLSLDRSPAIGDRLLAFGFPNNHPGGDSFTAKVEGVTNDGSAHLLEFRSGQVAEGFSGAPLYNLDRRGVSGVVKSTRDPRTSFGGRAVAIASVLEVLPSVRALAWDLSSPGHQRDRAGLSASEQIETLAREVLAGDAVVVVGDVLDSSDRLSRQAVAEFIRRDSLKSLDNDSKRFRLLNYLRSAPSTTSKAYETLAHLPFSTVVSLHPDAQLERALHSYRAVTLDESLRVSELAVGKRDLYLFGGSVLFGKGLILDQDDRDDLRERYNRLYRGFRDRLAMAPILFVGCGLAHWATRRLLFDILRHRTPLDGKLFAAASRSDWSAVIPGDTTVIDMAPEELLSALDEAVAGRRPIQMRTWVDQIPEYKGFRYLDHYTESDRSVFFARSHDCEALLGLVLSAPSKISVLCGQSGTGKTSLVLAGLQPLLHSQTHMRVEYLRSTADPLRMLEHSLVNLAGVESDYSLATDSSFLELRKQFLEMSNPILFVIDQLEEAFVKGGKQTTKEFLATIRDLATLDWFPARFLLVVREDFLHELADDRAGGASTLASVYRLPDFDHAAASIVVKETATAMGWECEPGFVGAMLEDLSPDHILPSHLQIVCHCVQEASTHLSRFNVSTYTRLGRASAILRNHVDNALEGLPGANIRLIKSILAAMVTSRDTKFLLTGDEIASRSALPPETVAETLLELIHDFRLVREIQLDDVRFELAHESLVPTVIEWLDASDHNLRTVQDIVDQEVVLGRRDPGHLISDDRLLLIESVLNELNLSEDALSLVASSFCVRGSIPAAVADRLTVLPKHRQIESLWVRPVASDSHQFEAVLRSSVSDAFPECDPSDLPEPLRSRIADALRTGDDQIFRRLLKFLRLTPGLEAPILERVADGGTALRSLIDAAPPDSLALLTQQAGRSLSSTIFSLRLGLRLILEYIDRCVESANDATECVDGFFRQARRDMRRADALRVASEFLADGLRPRNPVIFGIALCALARRGSRSLAPDRLLTKRGALFVQDAITKAQPDQAIAICAGLLNDALDSDSDRLPWLSGLGSLVLSSLENLSGDCDIVFGWVDREPAGAELLARALGWSIRLPDCREMSEGTKYRVERGITALLSSSALSYRLATEILSDADVILFGNDVDLWDLPGPTEAELAELEASLAEDLEVSLVEDRVVESPWLDPDLRKWADSELKDTDDNMSDGTWWNHAWTDPD